jgi:hypothetical protein
MNVSLPQAGQRGLGGGRAQHQDELVLQVAEELEDVQPDVGGDEPAEHHDDEQDRGHVEQRDEPPEAGQRGEAELADRTGHRAERTERGRLHDEAEDLEDDLREPPDDHDDRFAHRADGIDRDPERAPRVR